MKKQFNFLLLKNTLAFTVPAILVLCVLLFMFVNYPVFDQATCIKLEPKDSVESTLQLLYNKNTTNVMYNVTDIYYSGYDYLVDGKRIGSYYYKFENSKMQLYLVKTSSPKPFIEKASLKGKIIKDSLATQHILQKLAEKNNIDQSILEGYVSEFLISEPDYPYSFIWMIYVIFYMPITISVVIVIYTLLVWVNPMFHSQVKQLDAYGDIATILDELNLEMKNHMLMRKNNVYITENYLIVNYLTKTEVVRLDAIQYMAKEEMTAKSVGGEKDVYRLTMSAPEKFFYEVDFSGEDLVDDVIDYVKNVNPKVKM